MNMSAAMAAFDWREHRVEATDVLDTILQVALELAHEGREGRCVGTIFVVGDPAQVIPHSRPLILDPLHGHADSCKRIADPEVRETLKEISQLDGAILISRKGIAVSAARYLDVTIKGVQICKGLGSRHMAGAAISHMTDSVSIVVSASGTVRIYVDGNCVGEFSP